MQHLPMAQSDGDDGETSPDMDGPLEPMNSIRNCILDANTFTPYL